MKLILIAAESVFHPTPRAETNFKGCNPVTTNTKFSYLRRQVTSGSYQKCLKLKDRWEGTDIRKKIVISDLETLNGIINMIAFAYDESTSYKNLLKSFDSPWVQICENLLTEQDNKKWHSTLGQFYLKVLKNLKSHSVDTHGFLLNGSFEIKNLITENFIDGWISFEVGLTGNKGSLYFAMKEQLDLMLQIEDEEEEHSMILIFNTSQKEMAASELPENLNGYILSGVITTKSKNIKTDCFYGRLRDKRWFQFEENSTKLVNLTKKKIKLVMYLK
jgi:hypothetical protein